MATNFTTLRDAMSLERRDSIRKRTQELLSSLPMETSMKAHAEVTYDENFPFAGFWKENWLLQKLVQVLQARGKLQFGQKLRVIVVPDNGQETVFLQGTEVHLLDKIVEDFMSLMHDQDHPDYKLAEQILRKARETSTPTRG